MPTTPDPSANTSFMFVHVNEKTHQDKTPTYRLQVVKQLPSDAKRERIHDKNASLNTLAEAEATSQKTPHTKTNTNTHAHTHTHAHRQTDRQTYKHRAREIS